MPQRHYNSIKTEATKASKRVCLPMDREDYEVVVKDAQRFRAYLDDMVSKYPELFPVGMEQGYWLYGWERQSVKMPEVANRRICLCTPDEGGQRQV